MLLPKRQKRAYTEFYRCADEMQIVCGYALQDKSWVSDPDGNQWEVFVVHKDNLPTYYGSGETCDSNPDSCATEVESNSSCGCVGSSASALDEQNAHVGKASE